MKKKVEIDFDTAENFSGGLYAYVYRDEFFLKHNINPKKQILIQYNSKIQMFCVEGWEVEDAKETED